MLKSMTGYGSGTAENEFYKVQAEIKAVNQRFLDIDFHLPRKLFPWEDKIRGYIKNVAARGKLSVYITLIDKRPDKTTVKVNRGLAEEYFDALREINGVIAEKIENYYGFADKHKFEITDTIANFPEVLTVEEKEAGDFDADILLGAVETAMAKLNEMRCTEGENLRRDFVPRLKNIDEMVSRLETLAPEIIAAYREKLTKTLNAAVPGEDFDETRLMQEVAVYADKVNFTEEIVRLRSHLEQYDNLLQVDEPVGRKLDFLLQEMNRETNTIGSKANNAAAAHLVVDLKGELEKLREQVQNIE